MDHRRTDVWVQVVCRICSRQYECIKGLPAELTRMCLWCDVSVQIQAEANDTARTDPAELVPCM